MPVEESLSWKQMESAARVQIVRFSRATEGCRVAEHPSSRLNSKVLPICAITVFFVAMAIVIRLLGQPTAIIGLALGIGVIAVLPVLAAQPQLTSGPNGTPRVLLEFSRPDDSIRYWAKASAAVCQKRDVRAIVVDRARVGGESQLCARCRLEFVSGSSAVVGWSTYPHNLLGAVRELCKECSIPFSTTERDLVMDAEFRL